MIFTDSDLIFDGYNFANDLKVEEVRRPLLQPIENIYIQMGNRGIHRKARRMPYHIEVDIRLIKTTRTEITEKIRLIAGKLYKDGPKKLELRGDTRFDIAVLDGQIDFERMHSTGFATLTFLVMESSFGLYKTGSVTNTITVTGTDETYPIIKITPATTQSVISFENVTTSEKITLQKSVTSGQLIQFGSFVAFQHAQSCKVAGVNAMVDVSLASDFPKLAPGVNTIVVTGATSATVEYWERWL